MLKALGIIAVVAIIAWIIGYLNSNGDKDKANESAIVAGTGCGYILLQIFFAGLTIMIIIWLFSVSNMVPVNDNSVCLFTCTSFDF